LSRRPAPPRFRSRTALLLAAAVAVVDLFVVAGAWRSLRFERRARYQEAARSAQNLARVLGENLDATVDSIDLALLATAEEIERERASGGVADPQIERFIARRLARLPFLDAIRITDERGLVVHGTAVQAGSKVSVADRDYFLGAKADSGAAMQISKPLLGRVSGKWSIIFARRTGKPDGSFGGVVYAAATLDQFTRSLARVDPGRDGAVALRDADNGLVARYPEREDPGTLIGQRGISPELAAVLQAGQTEATFVAVSPIDHQEKVNAFRRVAGGAFSLLVVASTRTFLEGWWTEVIRTSASVGLFVLLTLAGARLLVRSVKREGEARFQTLVEHAPIAVVITRGLRVAYANRAFAGALGLPDAALAIGRRITDSMGPDDAARTAERFERRARNLAVEPTAEVTLRRPDGTAFRAAVTDALIELGGGPAIVGFVQDVTERTRHAEERERLIGELKAALADVKTLRGLLPICAHCKKVRDDGGYWNRIETFIRERSEAEFTHSICPDCAERYFPDDEEGAT